MSSPPSPSRRADDEHRGSATGGARPARRAAARTAAPHPQANGVLGPHPAAPAVHRGLAGDRVGRDGGQPAAAVRRRRAHPARRVAVAAVAGRRGGAAAGALLHQRAVRRLPRVLDPARVRRHRTVPAPPVLRLDALPAEPAAQGSRVRRPLRARRRRDPRDHPPAGAVRGLGDGVLGAALGAPARLRVLLHRVPVRRAVLAALPGRRRHLLPRRHQTRGSGTSGGRTTSWPGSGRTSCSSSTPTRSSAKGAMSRAGSCCGARPELERRSWPRPSPARQGSRTCSSTPARSSTCSWASGSSRSSPCSGSCASSPCATAA